MINRLFVFCGLFLVMNLFPGLLKAQSEEVWAFGHHAGLDFNSGSPVPIKTDIMGFGEGQASVCDASGQLLFYTEGTYVWDRNNNLMPNGSNLTPVASTTSYTPTSSSSQGTLIMPMPGTTTKFYIFSLTSMEQNSTGNAGKLFYSIVDMTLNGGLGDVTQKGVIVDSGLSERMTAVVGNRCNVWLLTCSVEPKFKAYEISHSGISAPVVSNVGIEQEFTGYMVVSPDRKKLAATKCFTFGSSLRGAALYDFDVNTGLVTNQIPLLEGHGGYGVCFSPDNSKLYINSDFQEIYQYDLSSGNPATIQASGIRLGDATMSGIKLGPDGKIYFNYANTILGTINAPNLHGAAAQYTPNSITLLPGTNCISGLPNVVPIFDFTPDTAYSSQVKYPTCFNGNVFLDAGTASGWDYLWNDGESGPSRSVTKAGTYWVRYFTQPCNYIVDTFDVRYPSVETRNSCNEATNGMAWIKRAAGDPTNYNCTWRDTSGALLSSSDTLKNIPPGNYILKITAPGCEFEVNILIKDDHYDASFMADTLVCEQGKISFENTSDTFFDRYDWQFGDGTSSSLASPEHIYDKPGHFRTMLVASKNGCADTVYHDIIVDPVLSGRFITQPDSICVGESITFYSQADSTTVGLSWQFGDGTKMISLLEEESVRHAYDQAGMLPVKLSAQFRICPDTSFTDTVYVYDLPKVYLGADSTLCLNGAPIVLQNATLPAGNYHYLWNTGDTTRSLIVTHPGVYGLTVSAEPLGCYTTEHIAITKDCYINIPNAFTPNGDGVNDYFFPRQLLSGKLTAFKMQVFNRWGQVIFETTRQNGRGWDGKFNGKLQPEGVYVYSIDAEIDGVRQEHYQGNVTLIR